MALGVLQPRNSNQHVPGTALLSTEDTSQTSDQTLKRAGGKHCDVILIPQPSDDPNDPLNWPIWQRDLILLLYCYCTLCVIGGVGPVLSSMVVVLIEDLHIDFTKVSLLTGYNLCAVGACGVFISAFARKFGKRPVAIFSISCTLAGSIWGGAATSYASLLGARILQGVGIALFESLSFAVIGDLYCVHQRGRRMAFYVTSQSGLGNMPSMVAGKVTYDLGWRWVFWILCVFLGIAWVCVILFCWETQYNRAALYNTDLASEEVSGSANVLAKEYY
ncbi:hypothetical protein AUP68_15168 [Ilyonectria robusta]